MAGRDSRQSPQGEKMTYQEKLRKIFDAEEWAFSVPPQLSGLTPRPDLGVEYKAKFPMVTFGKFVLADGNILIQDSTPNFDRPESEQIAKTLQERLNNQSSPVTFQVVNAYSATEELARLIGPIDIDRTLIIYPGNGAKTVKDYMQELGLDIAKGITVPARRVSLGKGKFEISIDFPLSLPEKPKEVLVIDDVVASGQTCRELACALMRRYGTLPKMKLASWVMLSSAEFSSYYDNVFSSIVVKPNYVQRPPINSLSCLLSPESKYDRIKQQYSARYLRNSVSLDELEKLVKEEK